MAPYPCRIHQRLCRHSGTCGFQSVHMSGRLQHSLKPPARLPLAQPTLRTVIHTCITCSPLSSPTPMVVRLWAKRQSHTDFGSLPRGLTSPSLPSGISPAMSKMLAAICLLHLSGALSEPTGRRMPLPEGGTLLEFGSYNEFSACQEFRAEDTVGSGWLLEDCIDVWRAWTLSLQKTTLVMKENRQFFFEVSDRLRRQGTPCYVEAPKDVDGAGSRTLRYLASWLYAEEVGCDCLLPVGYRPGSGTDDILYCHRSKYIKEEDYRCAAVDWLGYFNMSNHMKPYPDDGRSTNTINVSEMSGKANSVCNCLRLQNASPPIRVKRG